MTIHLSAQPLSRENFAAFGDVLEAQGASHYPINNGTTERYHRLAAVEAYPDRTDPAPPETIINIFVAKPTPHPVTLTLMERHPLGSQAFMPLNSGHWLVVVAPIGPAPAANDLRAFIATAQQGVQYRAGVWHHPLLALHAQSHFMVIDRDGPGHNLDESPLTERVIVDLEN